MHHNIDSEIRQMTKELAGFRGKKRSSPVADPDLDRFSSVADPDLDRISSVADPDLDAISFESTNPFQNDSYRICF